MSARDDLHAELEQWMHSHTADALLDAYAHELAEQIRADVNLDEHPGEAIWECEGCATVRAANLIDPEAKP